MRFYLHAKGDTVLQHHRPSERLSAREDHVFVPPLLPNQFVYINTRVCVCVGVCAAHVQHILIAITIIGLNVVDGAVRCHHLLPPNVLCYVYAPVAR